MFDEQLAQNVVFTGDNFSIADITPCSRIDFAHEQSSETRAAQHPTLVAAGQHAQQAFHTGGSAVTRPVTLSFVACGLHRVIANALTGCSVRPPWSCRHHRQ